ncbi:Crp/Fnr family transcriptional regulator [Methylomonas sp. 2BW1-5-20]|uniref:Crp/Fnr family transcriptional regulator n=1 Tax=Methylomonas sp. 2BW1-5-20 TaxID=3376686 RepID=UPI00404E0B5C
MKELFSDVLANAKFSEGSGWKRYSLNAGETIIRKGEQGNTLFLVEEGVVRVLGGAELDGNRRISPGLCDLGIGAVFGDVCLYESKERTASVVALTQVQLLEVRSDMLSVYLDDHPVQGYLFLKALFQAMSNRLGLANDRIEHLLAWGIKAHDIDKYL